MRNTTWIGTTYTFIIQTTGLGTLSRYIIKHSNSYVHVIGRKMKKYFLSLIYFFLRPNMNVIIIL